MHRADPQLVALDAIVRQMGQVIKLDHMILEELDRRDMQKTEFLEEIYRRGHDPPLQLHNLVKNRFVYLDEDNVRILPKGYLASRLRGNIFTAENIASRNLHRGHLTLLASLVESPKTIDDFLEITGKSVGSIRNDLGELRKEHLVDSYRRSSDFRKKRYYLTRRGESLSSFYLSLRMVERPIFPEVVRTREWKEHIFSEYPEYRLLSMRRFIERSERRMRIIMSQDFQSQVETPNTLRVSEFVWWPGKKMLSMMDGNVRLQSPTKIRSSFEALEGDDLEIITIGLETLAYTVDQLSREISMIALIHFPNGFSLMRSKESKSDGVMVYNENSQAERHIADMIAKSHKVQRLESGINSHEEVAKVVMDQDAGAFISRHPIQEIWEIADKNVECLGYFPFDIVFLTDVKTIAEKRHLLSFFIQQLPKAFESFCTPHVHAQLAYKYAREIDPYTKGMSCDTRLSSIFERIIRSSLD